MTKRNQIFIIFVFLFFLLVPAAILYSVGYRIDWFNGQAVKTGAFYFKVFPRGAEIYLDKEIKKETSFFFNDAFVDNLSPKIYEIEIKKNNYQSWRKNLEVKEQMVTSAKNVLLIPANPGFELLNLAVQEDSYELKQNIEDFFFSPDGKELILKIVDAKSGWLLKSFDVQKRSYNLLLEEKDLAEISTSSSLPIKPVKKDMALNLIEEIEWANDSKKILLKANSGKETRYFILEHNDPNPNLFLLDFLGVGAEKISFEPGQRTKIFFLKNNDLFSADYSEKLISGPILDNLAAYATTPNSLFWLDNEGFLGAADFSGKKTSVLNREPFLIESGKEYEIIGRKPDKIFLKKDSELFFLNFQSAEFKKISGSVKNVELSPDEKKIAYSDGREISIFFLEPENVQPLRTAGENALLAEFAKEIDRLFWLNNHYLIFNAADEIKVSEIDNRDRVNVAGLPSYLSAVGGELVEVKAPKIFWNEFNKTLFVLTNGDIYFFGGLLR